MTTLGLASLSFDDDKASMLFPVGWGLYKREVSNAGPEQRLKLADEGKET